MSSLDAATKAKLEQVARGVQEGGTYVDGSPRAAKRSSLLGPARHLRAALAVPLLAVLALNACGDDTDLCPGREGADCYKGEVLRANVEGEGDIFGGGPVEIEEISSLEVDIGDRVVEAFVVSDDRDRLTDLFLDGALEGEQVVVSCAVTDPNFDCVFVEVR